MLAVDYISLRDNMNSYMDHMPREIITNTQMDYGIDISVVVKNKDQFEYWLGALPFYNNVKKEGIVL